MGKRLDLTDEERKARSNELARARMVRYRIRKGDLSVGRGRKARAGEEFETERVGTALIHRVKNHADEWRPAPTVVLTKDSKPEDLLSWVMEVAEELRMCPNPAAWASSLNAIIKILEFLDKKMPPKMPDVKPRPRQIIVIEDEQPEEDD